MNGLALSMQAPAAEPTQETDETSLVRKAQDGDVRSFEALYRTHVNRVHGLCWRLAGGDADTAAELAQDAFVRAWEKIGTFKFNAAFGTWLHRLTVNFVLSEKRKMVRRRELQHALEQSADTAKASMPVDGLDADLESVIARLPERARTVLVLHDIEGYQHPEIAKMADMAVGTSKAQLHRARKLLQEWLKQ